MYDFSEREETEHRTFDAQLYSRSFLYPVLSPKELSLEVLKSSPWLFLLEVPGSSPLPSSLVQKFRPSLFARYTNWPLLVPVYLAWPKLSPSKP